MSIVSAAVLLFFVMDPLGNIPSFLVALREVEPARRKYVIVRELLIALAVLVAFLIAGAQLLRVFHISEPSLSISGGIILFIIALRMVFPTGDGVPVELPDKEPFIVPLAVPLLAGPSAAATIILLVTREPERRWEWLLALVGAWLAAALILYFGAALSRLLGQRGLLALERLMGMLLTALAVQMTLDGIAAFVR
jgi:MarC family membrane protein